MFKIFKNQIITSLFTCLIFFPGSVFSVSLFGDDEDIIWKTGINSYIKYAKQDTSKFGKNDHPVELDEKDIILALEALIYPKKSLLSSEENLKPVFTHLQKKLLGEHLSTGLKNAKPKQDIIFVLKSSIKKMLGLREQSFLAGRAFYKEGKLNIIMGEYEYFISDAFEKEYDPSGKGNVPYSFNFGKRSKKSKVFEETFIDVTGVKFNRTNNKMRHDWFMIDVKLAAEAYLAQKNEKENPTVKQNKQLEIEAAKMARQRREMRAEMARMRKEMQDNSKNTSPAKSIEERIVTLDQLLDKKMITQEEYDSKRQEILNDI